LIQNYQIEHVKTWGEAYVSVGLPCPIQGAGCQLPPHFWDPRLMLIQFDLAEKWPL